MKTIKLCFLIWVVALLTACSSQTAISQEGLENASQDTANWLNVALPVPQHSTSDMQYAASQAGKDFLQTESCENCTVAGDSAQFSPNWLSSEESSFSDTAHCVYGLGLDSELVDAELTLDWTAPGPGANQAWLGLSQISSNRWEWQQLTSSEVALDGVQQYADGSRNVYVAIVVVGNGSLALESIRLSEAAPPALTYPLVDTGQVYCYDSDGNVISAPDEGSDFYGQDAQFDSNLFSFVDNGDGTVTDLVTGLMWQQIPPSTKYSWQEAQDYCDSLELADYTDWRAPTLKELFSISDFSVGWPYLDMAYLDTAPGTPPNDKNQQYWSANFYLAGTTHGGMPSAFGVNHATGHIKAYPSDAGGPMGKHVRAVRGGEYGSNQYVDNGDGTVTDQATGLMWMANDSSTPMDWPAALDYAETLELADYTDWRVPDVKELQSLVDYSGVYPAIDSLFSCTPIINEAGDDDFGYYWTSTSALFQAGNPYYYAWYVAFGRAVDDAGEDTHGAGAVRFDTKVEGGPLGEGGERYYNYVRCVRNAD